MRIRPGKIKRCRLALVVLLVWSICFPASCFAQEPDPVRKNESEGQSGYDSGIGTRADSASRKRSFTQEETETQQDLDRIGEIIENMTLEEKIGQMIMADFQIWNENPEEEDSEAVPVTSLNDEIREAIARDRFGGILLFECNCPGNEQTLELVTQMQEANAASDRDFPIPLLIATDQEGGIVARLGEGIRGIGNMAITATGDEDNAYTAASWIGQQLQALSINVDFAPVVDVNNNPGNPIIGVRSFSDDPEVVSGYGVRFLEGIKDTGTICALKHFPGHGDVATDSHTGFPILNKTYEELKECELIPFQAAIDAGADMVMTAHIQYPKIEKETCRSLSTGKEVFLPATLSHTILEDILRGDMGFEGVIVSDAMNMAAIEENFDRKEMGVMAINAGIDMILMPVPVTDAEKLDELEEFMAYLCEMVRNGTIDESRIDESVRRILKVKESHGILDQTGFRKSEEEAKEAAAFVGNDEMRAMEWEMMQKAVTLLHAKEGLIPIKARPGGKAALIFTMQNRVNYAEIARQRLVEEGLIPEDYSFEVLVCSEESRADCVRAARQADCVIAVSSLFNVAALDPDSDSGVASSVLDDVLEAAHKAGKPFILLSSQLPYDAVRYPGADAVVLSYGSTMLNELPKGRATYSVNLPAAICGIFGEYEFAGRLSVTLPTLNEDYTFSKEPAAASRSGIDYLALVNKLNPLPEGWEDELKTVMTTNSVGDEVEVEEKAFDAYLALKEDLEENDGIFLELDSARRTVAGQQEIMDRFIEKYGADYAAKTVAVPGFSEHHTGLALDLYFRLKGDDGQFTDVYYNEDMVQYPKIWEKIHAKLAGHGFILRYPEGREHITGYGYEPWHIRYVDSVDIAKAIMDRDITLEEYLGAVNAADVTIDLGKSTLYTEEELKEAVVQIKCRFAGWEGCELHSIRYAGDKSASEENLRWMNELDENGSYTQAAEFLMDFHTPKEQTGAWEADEEYTDYEWWLARSEDGGWEVVTQGYG